MAGNEVNTEPVPFKIPEVLLNAPLPEGANPKPGHWVEFTEEVLQHYKRKADFELARLEDFFNKDETIRVLDFKDIDSLVTALQIYGITPRPSDELYPGGALEIYVASYMFPDNHVAQELFGSIEARCAALETKVKPVIEKFNNLDKDEQKRYLEDPRLKVYVPFLLSKMEGDTSKDISRDERYLAANSRWEVDSKTARDKVNQMDVDSLIQDMEGNDPEVRNNAETTFNDRAKELLPTSARALNSLMAKALVKDQLKGNDQNAAEDGYLEENGLDKNMIDIIVRFAEESSGVYQRYYTLKAKLLHPENPALKYSERTLMFPSDIPTTFEEGMRFIKKVLLSSDIDLSQLDSLIDDYLTKGKIDVTVGNGKISQPLAFMTFPGQLPYISSRMEIPSLRGLSEMSHEVGHLIESLQSSLDKTPGVSVNKDRGVGEVTSQYFELAVYRFIYEQAKALGNNITQAEALLNIANLELTAIHRKVSAYKFQREVHARFREKNKDKTVDEIANGNYTELTPEEISEIYSRNDREFMGRAVSSLEGSENWWTTNKIYFGRGLSQPFVDIEYAIGMIGAMNLYLGINSGNISMDSALKFIGAGSTLSTPDLLKLIGADLGVDTTLRNINNEFARNLQTAEGSLQTEIK